MRKLKITELNRISVEEFKEAEKLPLVVVLDNIRSLHNIGSVFRTSDAFRIECIYLCGITAIPPHPEMHKTALGAEFTVDWKYVDNSVEAVDNLKSEGYIVYSVEQAEGSVMLDELVLDKTKKYAVVMGNEVKGVQQEVIDHSHGCIEIPQYGTKHSLTVSATAGVGFLVVFLKPFVECIGYCGYCYLGFIQETEIITGLLISCQYIGFVGAIDRTRCIYRSSVLHL